MRYKESFFRVIKKDLSDKATLERRPDKVRVRRVYLKEEHSRQE